MNNWLNNFTYRVHFNYWLFGYGLAASLLIILLTVSYHIIKAMHANPAATLKYE